MARVNGTTIPICSWWGLAGHRLAECEDALEARLERINERLERIEERLLELISG
jgi:hypothetical protein